MSRVRVHGFTLSIDGFGAGSAWADKRCINGW
jgi:hypothetical protein